MSLIPFQYILIRVFIFVVIKWHGCEPLIKVCWVNTSMKSRNLCPVCHERPVAINCYHDNRPYYRKLCDPCLRKGKKLKPVPPLWFKMGYRKKLSCDKCGFTATTPKQMFVFHVDGNLKNVDWANLRTVCANCQIEIFSSNTGWAAAPIVPDF